MTRMPPRFPRPETPQRSFRTPLEPGMIAPASGSDSKACCELQVFVVGQIFLNEPREQLCLNEADHLAIIRQ